MNHLNPYLQAALQLHGWGANVTAITAGAKEPLNKWKHYQHTRQTTEDVRRLAWDGLPAWEEKNLPARSCGGLGFISGINGWRGFDIDRCPSSDAVDIALARMDLPLDYPWVYRSGSGTGWEIVFLCHDDMPEGALSTLKGNPGVYWMGSKAGDFDHLELRWERCQTLLPPSQHPTGPGYQWRHEPPTEPPATVTVGHVLAAAYTIGVLRRIETPQPSAGGTVATATRREDLSERAAQRRAAWCEKAIREELDAIRTAPEGQRNDTLFKRVCRIFQFVKSEDVRESDIERDIRSAAAGYIAADGESAYLKTYNSARQRGLAEDPRFPDFEEDDTPEAEPAREKVLIGTPGDGATVLLEQYQQLENKLWAIVTADTKQTGWDPSVKVLGIYTQLALFRNGGEELVFDRGAAAVAPQIGLSGPTVGTHVDRLVAVGLATRRKGKSIVCDKSRRQVPMSEVDPARKIEEQGYHWEKSEAELVLKSLPSGDQLPVLPRTERQKKQVKREEAKREEAENTRRQLLELRETVEKLEAACCPLCGSMETLHAMCSGCDSIVTASELAKMTGTEPDAETAQEQAIKTFNSIKQGEKVLIGTPGDGATDEPSISGGRKGTSTAELPLWVDETPWDATERPPVDDHDYKIRHGAHMDPPRLSTATAAD